MKKIAIFYKSNYGHTQRYAQWLTEALQADLYESKEISSPLLQKYDIIIFGGGLYAGGFNGFSLLQPHIPHLRDQLLVCFTCGLADPKNPTNLQHIREGLEKAIPPEIFQKIHFFHLRGGIDYGQLGLVHKSMMAMLNHQLKKADPKTLSEEDKEVLATYGKQIDFTDRETLRPLIQHVQTLQTEE